MTDAGPPQQEEPGIRIARNSADQRVSSLYGDRPENTEWTPQHMNTRHSTRIPRRARIDLTVVVLLVVAGMLGVWSAVDATYTGTVWSLYDGRTAVGALLFVVAFVVWMLGRIEDGE